MFYGFPINVHLGLFKSKFLHGQFYLQKTQEHVRDKPLLGEVTEHVVMETAIKNEVLAAGPQMEPLVSDTHCMKTINLNRYFLKKK